MPRQQLVWPRVSFVSFVSLCVFPHLLYQLVSWFDHSFGLVIMRTAAITSSVIASCISVAGIGQRAAKRAQTALDKVSWPTAPHRWTYALRYGHLMMKYAGACGFVLAP